MRIARRTFHLAGLVPLLVFAASNGAGLAHLAAADGSEPVIEYRDTNPTIDVVDSIRLLSTDKAGELESQIKAAFLKLAPSVVRIWKLDAQEQVSTSGGGFSGVIIDPKGLILTCSHHDLKPDAPVSIELAVGTRIAGKMLGRFVLDGSKPGHSGPDIGLATITESGKWPAAEVNGLNQHRDSEICLAIGYPGTLLPGRPPLLRLGRVVPSFPDYRGLQTTTTCVAGDSGGPLFDVDGRVLGVLNSNSGAGVIRYESVALLKEHRDRLEAGELVDAPARAYRASRARRPQAAAFSPALDLEDRVHQMQRNVIRIMDGPYAVAAGLIVDPDGWAVTKASLVGSRRQWSCRLFYTRHGNMIVKGVVVATSAEHDVALLKLDLQQWFPLKWSNQPLSVGSFVASHLGRTAGPLEFSVVGATESSEPPRQDMLPLVPISLLPDETNPDAEPVIDLSGLRTAEFDNYRDLFEPGDVITRLNDTPTPTRLICGQALDRLAYAPAPLSNGVDYKKPLSGLFHGDWVSVGIRRGPANLTIRVPRIHSVTQGALEWHSHPLSIRRESFPSVFSHDYILSPEQCGGPVVDLAGRIVGLNIARADETRTLAIPAETLQEIIRDLRKQAGNSSR
jgi:serine protease Do